MARLLFIAHAPSENTVALMEATTKRITGESKVELITKPPLEASAKDVLGADGVLIATTENIGYMAGLTKDFFDRSYNDMLETTTSKPVALYIRAGLDGTGTKRALEAIFTGLRWKLIAEPLILHGKWQADYPEQAAELGLTLAAGLEMQLY